MAKKRDFMQHWPVIALALVVLGIFLSACVTFQVQEYEVAVRKTFGKAQTDADGKTKVYSPGLHFRWPAPIDEVWRHDNRIQCYELGTGGYEQLQTRDGYSIIVNTFVLWRIGDPGLFMRSVTSSNSAREKLNTLVRDSRGIVFGQHNLSELIKVRDLGELTKTNDDELQRIEREILEDHVYTPALRDFGIEVVHIGVKHIGFAETVTAAVFERMKAERKRKASEYRSEGESRARQIEANADRLRREIITAAEAKAKGIRSEGEAKAASEYRAFAENPELAMFLRNLEAFSKVLRKEDTIVLDTNTPPFTLLKKDAIDFAAKQAKQAESKDAAK
jgi:membrane protease subunit HflC